MQAVWPSAHLNVMQTVCPSVLCVVTTCDLLECTNFSGGYTASVVGPESSVPTFLPDFTLYFYIVEFPISETECRQ
jgi:hypothetical protein